MDLRGTSLLVTAIAVGLTIAPTALASARVPDKSWRGVYRVLHRSDSRALRRQAARIGVSSSRARVSVVGGGQIAITQAPWQVLVLGVIPKGENEVLILLCGGSVIDETRIVTAGHCMFDPTTGLPIPAEDLLVVAGAADIAQADPGEQEAEVASVRVHPDFDYSLGPNASDDVAVITLAKTLTFRDLVQPIGLVSAGEAPAEGTRANLTGFGRQSPPVSRMACSTHWV
jgi:hypothetical protein